LTSRDACRPSLDAQLGHTDISMVIKHYYRWVKNPARQDGSLFDKKAAEAGL